MIRIAITCALTGFLLGIAPIPASAHHSGSKYDRSMLITLEGTVRQFQWTTPHVIIWINVDAEGSDDLELWAIQLTSPGNLRRSGWTHRSLKAGDRVQIDANPLRDGGRGAGLNKVTIIETGEVLYHFPPRPGAG